MKTVYLNVGIQAAPSPGSATPTGPAGGSLSGTYPDPSIADSGVVTGTYGAATVVPVLTVNADGRVSTATTAAIPAASTSSGGLVELATDNETAGGVAVQGSDSRLAAAPSLWSVWGQVFPRGTVSPPSYVGNGALSAQGVYAVNVSEPGFPAVQFGDAGVTACRFTIVGAFRLDAGTWQIDYFFKLGSDITTGTQSYWIGMFNGTTLDGTDPSTSNRVGLRYVSGTDTNWQLSTKDGVTPNNVDSGVAVTASYYYVVRLQITTTTYAAKIGRGATLQAAQAAFSAFTPVANNSNLPGSATDLQIISSVNRTSASVTRGIISGAMYWRCSP